MLSCSYSQPKHALNTLFKPFCITMTPLHYQALTTPPPDGPIKDGTPGLQMTRRQ